MSRASFKLIGLLLLLSLILISSSAADTEEVEVVAQATDVPRENEQEKITEDNDEEVSDMEIFDDFEELDFEHFLSEWDDDLNDFEADEILTFEVKEGTEEVFIEEITNPTTMRGAFQLSQIEDINQFEFSIRDPVGKRIFFQAGKLQKIFNLNVTDIGEYKFTFSNLNGTEIREVQFALDVHNVTESHLKHTDLDPIEGRVEIIAQQLRTQLSEQRFESKRQQSHMDILEHHHSRLLTFSIVEIFIVIFTTAWQIYYIKKILDNQRIV